MDLKGLGYLISSVSVILLGVVAWPGPDEPNWHAVAVLLGAGRLLPEHLFLDAGEAPEPASATGPLPFPASLDAIERAYLMWVLGSEGGNKSKAAETLGIDPSTLSRKLTRFGVEA